MRSKGRRPGRLQAGVTLGDDRRRLRNVMEQEPLLIKRITQALKGRRICPRMFCRPFRAKVSTVFLQGFHPCLCSERPFGALRQGFSNFRNMSTIKATSKERGGFCRTICSSLSGLSGGAGHMDS